MKMKYASLAALTLGAAALTSCNSQPAAECEMVIQANQPGAEVHKTMYGIFFEDINFAADGGLYAEMIKNRSFEFPQNLQGWTAFGKFEVLTKDAPFANNPHYVRLSDPGHPHKRTGIENEGFFGISVREGENYRFSLWARVPQGGSGNLEVQLVDNDTMEEHQEFTNDVIVVTGKDWKKYEVTITSTKTIEDARLRIFLRPEEGRDFWTAMNSIDIEHVSLFPTDTWKGRENGMRKDLAQALYDLHPGVFRFPGGCIVEGTNLEQRYQWKNSVGPVENRKMNDNRWENTFPYRLYPEYHQTYGLGFFEFFQLCEDFGCEPLPVISCGLACQFQNEIWNEKNAHVALKDLKPYIQDALDLVEFANGPVDSKWGKVRAEMGHPEPFNLHYLGVGNEQWDYDEAHGGDNAMFTSRLKLFSDALRAAYPDLKLIGTTGPNSEGWDFDLLQPRMKELGVDLYDEHYYRNEEWFLGHATDKDGKPLNCGAHRYDSYDREGPAVFAGEYACHGAGKKWNHFETSLYEAAHMTGIERNADIVHMATYAPLFAHVKGWQWRPDAIWFDNMRSMKSVSYYVQQLYSLYKGTNVLPLTMDGKVVAGDDDQKGLFASAVVDSEAGNYIVKVVNTSDADQTIALRFDGLDKVLNARELTLQSDDLDADNTLDEPEKIIPQESTITTISGNVVNVTVKAKTFAVVIAQ